MTAPYYVDDSVTLFCWVNCHPWHLAEQSDRRATKRASVARMCHAFQAVCLRGTYKLPIMWSGEFAEDLITTPGRATWYQKRAAAPALCACIRTLGRARSVVPCEQSDTTGTATRPTTIPATSGSSAVGVTWLRTVV